MPRNGEALPNISGNEGSSQERPQRLSRSPHPYHLPGASFSQDDGIIGSYPSPSSALTPVSSEPPLSHNDAYFDADHRKRRKVNETPSDSGTEADDEKGAFLLGLPAPPLRPRKGLKDRGGVTSPLLTPSYLDDDRHKAALEAGNRRRTSLQGHRIDEETVKLREKFTRQRRAELKRRVTETILLLTVCYVATQGHRRQLWPWLAAEKSTLGRLFSALNLESARLEIISYIITVLGLYALYPLRIIKKNHRLNAARRKSRLYIHLPAAFDPAPLLYPVFLPAVLAWSVAPSNRYYVLPNLILGISSIPSKIIPIGDLAWYSSPQWFLSILPMLTTRKFTTGYVNIDPEAWPNVNDAEILLLLYPLHQILLPVLQYLTTTSLLTTELQLLSTSMINLLLLSTSPQAQILKALLWLGGVLILIMCNKVTQWEVALARIPSWRFRRSRGRFHRNNSVVGAIDETFNGRLSRWGFTSFGFDPCDSEAELPQYPKGQITSLQSLKMRPGAANGDPGLTSLHQVSTSPRSATGNGNLSGFPSADRPIPVTLPGSNRLRRNTLPSYEASTTDKSFQLSLKRAGSHVLQSSKSWSLRSLTASQAMVLRWAIAVYVYVIVVITVALPVRMYVQRHAVHGHEPVGWALGYLFGDAPLFNSFTEERNLWAWIDASHRIEKKIQPTEPARTANVFGSYLGFANTRLLICIYCLSIIASGLTVVFRLSATVEVDTRRKVFHGMMVAMFLPTIFADPTFASLALILVLAIFLLLDLFRASQLPPISKPLTYFLAPYVDGRDHRGPVIVSHIFLLIGCAIPLWLSLAALPRSGKGSWEGWEVERRDLSMIAGVVCVGMGDAAASLIGRRYGHRRWCWSGGKSLEGSLAFAVAVVLGLSTARLWLLAGGWKGGSGDSTTVFLMKAAVAALGAGLTEAVLTGGNDNVIVPVVLWLLVRGLGM